MTSIKELMLWAFAGTCRMVLVVLKYAVKMLMTIGKLLIWTIRVLAQFVVDYAKRTMNGKKVRRRIRGKNMSSSTPIILPPLPSAINNDSTTMTYYPPSLVDAFIKLAKDLEPSEEFIKAGRQNAHTVFQRLKMEGKNHNIRIARTIIGGSTGKGTGICYDKEDGSPKNPDFDCVVYVNDQRPPFTTTLEAFYSILLDHPSIKDLDQLQSSVKFTFEDDEFGDMQFDLLPARNYAKQTELLTAERTVGDVQQGLALEDLTNIQTDCIRQYGQKIDLASNRLYSSGFCESTVQFIKTFAEDDYILDVVRLAKFWNANIEIDKLVPARSCIIELIAIYAQQGFERTCLVTGFERFLDAMSDLRNGYITFNNNDSSTALMMASSRHCKPTIIDPSNNYNNLAERITPRTVNMFETQARKTLWILEWLKRSEGHHLVENAIDMIFCHK